MWFGGTLSIMQTLLLGILTTTLTLLAPGFEFHAPMPLLQAYGFCDMFPTLPMCR